MKNDEPEIDKDELEALRIPEGDDTDESRRYERRIKYDLKTWKKNSDKNRHTESGGSSVQ